MPRVNISSSLVHYNNIVLADDRPSQTDKLSLTNTEIASPICYDAVEV